MRRTTIIADESLLGRLRAEARRAGVSLAEVIREALEWRAGKRRRRLGFIGSGESRGPRDTARRAGDVRFQPRSRR